MRDLDFGPALVGYLACIRNDRDFAMVTVDEVAATLCRPGRIDFDLRCSTGTHRLPPVRSPTVLAERQWHGPG